MSPSGNSADPPSMPHWFPGVLNEGEIVIPATATSPFVLLASWPVIAVCALSRQGRT